jgi:hypothetical protein
MQLLLHLHLDFLREVSKFISYLCPNVSNLLLVPINLLIQYIDYSILVIHIIISNEIRLAHIDRYLVIRISYIHGFNCSRKHNILRVD